MVERVGGRPPAKPNTNDSAVFTESTLPTTFITFHVGAETALSQGIQSISIHLLSE